MKKFLNTKSLLIIIFFIAVFFRFLNLGTNPPGVHADEADSGYNAFSILKTGRDMYGNFLPIEIIGFARNHRTPLSTYLTIPSVAVFGLNSFTIRLPAALLGVLFVFLMYILVKQLFKDEKIAIISAAITAVNPWAIHISRAYADHILALNLVLVGLIILLYKKKTIIWGAIAGLAFGLSLFSYHAPKLFLPFFIPLTLFFLRKDLLLHKKYLIAFIIVVALFFLGVFSLSFLGNGAQEFHNVSIINNELATKSVDRDRRVTYAPLEVSSIIHNKPLFYARELLRNVGKFLSITYLYIEGEGNLTATIGDQGVFYLTEFPFLIIGFYFLFRKYKRNALYLSLWFIFAVIPASIVKDAMYTYRGIYLLPVIIMITALGIYSFFSSFKQVYKKILIGLFIFVYCGYVIAFFVHYFYDYPFYSRNWWAADQHDALTYVIDNKKDYKQVYVNGGIDWPLLYVFYTQYDPQKFQDTLKKSTTQLGQKFVKIDNVYFGIVHPKKTSRIASFIPSNSLYIGDMDDFSLDSPIKSILSKEDWGTVFKIFDRK